jgi:putative membrane-bound dehydrogenase-like protein
MSTSLFVGKRLRLSIALGVGALLLGTTAYQPSGLSRSVNAYLDSLLTEEQKRLPENALKGLKVADGLVATTFATEPMLKNPTNIDVDHRGRVWVCEAYNYRPAITGNPTNEKGDRIVILEDTDGDGKADNQKVFYQGSELNAPLGIWVMGNRAIVSQSPYVWLFTDDDGDDRADRKEIIFQGMKGEQHDHGMHAFVFGPDGKFYFNFGNEGQLLLDKNGQPVKDQFGKEISPKNYRQGMVFRCNPDFTGVEVLGHNFRNNFEVAVDSYGTLWQSDNDDDGNKGVRINYVMEGGNYGYTDERTGAGWQASRTNLEATIPERHWHLNDPGVVPNLLQTGAGSPTGILVYEGSLLPQVFHNQVIHCDAGPNVVRSYPVTKAGAGYSAQIVNLLKGEGDQWFRPADVCAAPDGSLLVADWYDPGVGGHQAGDLNRGRLYRVAPNGSAYSVPKMDLTTAAGAVQALQSPNLSVRYQAWNALQKMGTAARPELEKLWQTGTNPRMRARAFWALAKGPGGQAYVDAAVKEALPELRIAGLRAARQTGLNVPGYVRQLVRDSDPQVRRECALALRGQQVPEAAELWATLATQHDGQDRWYLEALGIGADGQWDRYFAAYLKQQPHPTQSSAGRDLIWRARTEQAIPFLASLAGESTADLSKRLRYFRAFDFNTGKSKSEALLKLLQGNDAQQTDVSKLALRHLDAETVKANPAAMQALKKLLTQLDGAEYLELESRYSLSEENPRLMKLALANASSGLGRNAMTQLLHQEGSPMVWKAINGPDEATALQTLQALRMIGNQRSLTILQTVALDPKRSATLRKNATTYLGNSGSGEDLVLQLLKENKIEKAYIPAAVQGVQYAWRKAVRKEAASYLGASQAQGKKLPAIPELLAMNGEPKRGVAVFQQQCAICHQVNGEGMDFGPKLSEIGSKLPKEGQYLAILHPSAGISFGYEGWELKMKDGSTLVGIIASKTETDIDLKYPGGTTQRIKTSAVKSMKQLPDSMMPAGLHEAMSTQELVDLVEYLASLKRR